VSRWYRMSKTIVNFILDTTLLVIVVSLLFTSAVLRFVFPAPTLAGGWTLWGHGYDAWANFQFVLLAVIALAVLLHVMLHWSWVCGVIVTKLLSHDSRKTKPGDGVQTLWGVGLLIVVVTILGVLVALANLMVEPAPSPTAAMLRPHDSSHLATAAPRGLATEIASVLRDPGSTGAVHDQTFGRTGGRTDAWRDGGVRPSIPANG
jgi:hypothetical protein